MNSGEQYLVEALERLLALPLRPKSALAHWHEEAQLMQQTLRSKYPELEIPSDIWHFIADADIRSKETEAEYRHAQEATVRQYILKHRGGVGVAQQDVPSDANASRHLRG